MVRARPTIQSTQHNALAAAHSTGAGWRLFGLLVPQTLTTCEWCGLAHLIVHNNMCGTVNYL